MSHPQQVSGTGPRIDGYLKLSVFVAGACVMATEVSAPRLLAPSFGSAQFIWMNIIGTVLGALTLGAIIGGRLADRYPSTQAYASVLLASGILLAIVPFASQPVLARALEALRVQAASGILLSLAVVCLLFAPPVLLLGMATPWAIRLAGSHRPDLGRVAGLFSGLAAGGSIAGVFLAPLVLIPLLGTQASILAAATLLAVVGSVGIRSRRIAAPLALLALLPLNWATGSRHGSEVLFAGESLYQRIVVNRDRDGWISLRFDEGIGVQSVKPSSPGPTGGAWDAMAKLPSLLDSETDPLRVLILGLAGGTVAALMEQRYGDLAVSIDGVEMDPMVIQVARRFFDLDQIRSLRVFEQDARVFITLSGNEYDLILVDAYRGFYVPFHLATVEFFEECDRHLAPGGILAINIAIVPGAERLLGAFTNTLLDVFREVVRVRIAAPDSPFENHLILASDRGVDDAESAWADELATLFGNSTEPLASRGGWIFTDDRAPVELLTDLAIVEGAFLTSGGKP